MQCAESILAYCPEENSFLMEKEDKAGFLQNSQEVLSDALIDKRTLCRFIYYLFKCARKKNHSKPVKLFQLKNHIPLASFLCPNFPFLLSIVPPLSSLSLSSFSPTSKSCTLFLALENMILGKSLTVLLITSFHRPLASWWELGYHVSSGECGITGTWLSFTPKGFLLHFTYLQRLAALCFGGFTSHFLSGISYATKKRQRELFCYDQLLFSVCSQYFFLLYVLCHGSNHYPF